MTTKIPPSKLKEVRCQIGKKLGELRKEKNISQDVFSEISGLSQSTISKVENGVWAFSTNIIAIYIHVLSVKVDIYSEDVL